MANKYFGFKRFIIHQEYAAMKVCTDSCLFGAWIANQIEQHNINAKTILDIGTGTGLLSIMLAQKTNADIDAVDVDLPSYKEASTNCKLSPWSERLHTFYSDIKNWEAPSKYDLIICNPPFYEKDLLPADKAKIISRHSNSLSVEDLLIKAKTLLAQNGYFAVMLPHHRSEWFINIARTNSFYITRQLEVKQTIANNTYFRSMFILQHKQKDILKSELSIKDNSNGYTKEFINLMKDYYLYL